MMAQGDRPTVVSEFQRAERHLRRAVAAEQALADVRAVLDSDDHTLTCDHWRGDGGCTCLAERIRAVLDHDRSVPQRG